MGKLSPISGQAVGSGHTPGLTVNSQLRKFAGGEQRRLDSRLHTGGQWLQLFWLQPTACTFDILMTQYTERLV